MGNSKSKPETPEERLVRLQSEYGVLMPPSFVNGSRLPISSQAALQASQAVTPSLLDYLWITNPGTRLLEEYLQPGISMRIPTSTRGGDILVCLQPAKSDTADVLSNIRTTKLQSSSIMATHYQYPFQLEVLVPTHHRPSIQLSLFGSNFGLVSRVPIALDVTKSTISSDTGGWIEAKYKRQAVGGGMDFATSSWMTISSIQSLIKQSISTQKPTSIPTLHLQAGVDYQESVLAAQTTIPLTSEFLSGNIKTLPEVETMLSINLNHSPDTYPTPMMGAPSFGILVVYDVVDFVVTDRVAPLWLSLKHSSTGWILNLSQVLAFDRPVLNPFDERAPNIRQTLGWVVQVEKEQQHDETKKTSWSAGATYQMNRSTACKAVLVDGHTITYGAILKRWTQPRITLSLINSFHFPTGQHSQVGFGLELETAMPVHDHDDYATEYPEHPSLSKKEGPQTKIRIPKQNKMRMNR